MKKIILIGALILSFGLKCDMVSAVETNKDKSGTNEKKSSKEIANNYDDGNLKISLEDYYKYTARFPMFFVRSMPNEKVIKTNNGVNIVETDWKWNGSLDLSNKPKALVLHHIEASRPGETIPVTDIDRWHKANGWSGIGYHFYVTKSGKIYRGRPENAIGAHALGHNVNTLGIAVEGKYQVEYMPEKQKDAVIKLGQYLSGKYEISKVYRHKDLNSTDCPGKNYPFETIKNQILEYKESKPETENPKLDQSFDVVYQGQGQVYGWQKEVRNGKLAGTVGEYKRLEGIKIRLDNAPEGVGVEYRTIVKGSRNYSKWVKNGELSGSVGESKQMEAIQVKLTGNLADKYSIEYRAHVQDYGWMPWKENGETAGTIGENRRIEGIEIKLKRRNVFGVEYQAQGEGYGWQNPVYDGQVAGTTGKYKRLEGIKIKLVNAPDDLDVEYRSKVKGDLNYREWEKSGNFSGTIGQSKQMEAIQIRLIGKLAKNYSIKYRAHVQDHGWMNWVRDGEMSGTWNENRRIEAIEVLIEDRNDSFGIAYQVNGQDYGRQEYVNNGKLGGTVGEYRRAEGIKIKLLNPPKGVDIMYRVQGQDYGWQNWVYQNQFAGTMGEKRRLEAIKVILTGSNSEKYSVEYRAHCQDYGWMPWVKDGDVAGTVGKGRRLEGIEIRIVEKSK